jgi:hypothetical protein
MKKIKLFLFFCSWAAWAQNPPENLLRMQCISDKADHEHLDSNNLLEKKNTPFSYCGNTSQYYSQNSLYVPKPTQDIIYIKLNFIFLTKPDGTGNFEENNLEHQLVWDDIIANMNYRLGHIEIPQDVTCYNYDPNPANHIYDSRIRVIVNRVWKVDPAWNFLVTGYVPSEGPYSNNSILIPGYNYYYSYYDNDPTIREGINVVFANNGELYEQLAQGNCASGIAETGWAASEFPSEYNLSQKSRQFWPDMYTKYLSMKHCVTQQGYPWSDVRGWYVGVGYSSFVHELGHSLMLYHQGCNDHVMNAQWNTNHNYISKDEIGKMYRYASISSVRQYFTEDSYTHDVFKVNSDETWDLNFRIYSNVQVENGATLNSTCNMIMPAESRVIVKNGSHYIIESGNISSADNENWNGIKIEGTGDLLIKPNTLIDNGYFYAYTSNSVLPAFKAPVGEIAMRNQQAVEDKTLVTDIKIYPNPAHSYFNIDTGKEKLVSWELYDLFGRLILKESTPQVNVQQLSKANYILKVNLGTKQLSKIVSVN